jgi:hypothetical protein
VLAHLDRIAGRVKYLVPSLDPDDPGFDSIRDWRGPVLAVVNYMVAHGLADAGHKDLGHALRNETRTLIARGGFCESWCPDHGPRHHRRRFLIARRAVATLGWAGQASLKRGAAHSFGANRPAMSLSTGAWRFLHRCTASARHSCMT